MKNISRKILKHEAAVLKDKDPEELHQMRVGIRRLRSAIIGFAPAIALPKTSTEKIAGKIGKVLGELRDLDVLQLALKTEYQPNLPSDEQKYLSKATKKIAQKRKKAFKYVKFTLQGKTYRRFKQGIEDWLKKTSIYCDRCHVFNRKTYLLNKVSFGIFLDYFFNKS